MNEASPGPEYEDLLARLQDIRMLSQQGRGGAVLSQLQTLLVDIRLRASQSPPGSILFEYLCNIMLLALDTGRRIEASLGNWPECIDYIDELEALERARGADDQTLLNTNFNRYAPLLGLKRIPEAQTLLEHCLYGYRSLSDTIGEAKSLSALAIVADIKGDQEQAAELEEEALGIFRESENYIDLSASHGNLSRYYHRIGRIDEVGDHWVAAYMIQLLIGGETQTLTKLLAWHFQVTGLRGGGLSIPSLPALLEKSDFAELMVLVERANVSVGELQDQLAEVVEGVKEQVLAADAPVLALGDGAQCPCGSGKLFTRCHGMEESAGQADEGAEERQTTQGCPCGSGIAFEDCHGDPAPVEVTAEDGKRPEPKVVYIDMVLEKE